MRPHAVQLLHAKPDAVSDAHSDAAALVGAISRADFTSIICSVASAHAAAVAAAVAAADGECYSYLCSVVATNGRAHDSTDVIPKHLWADTKPDYRPAEPRSDVLLLCRV